MEETIDESLLAIQKTELEKIAHNKINERANHQRYFIPNISSYPQLNLKL